MTIKCNNCNKEFISKRADARFCGDKCRVTFNRNKKSVTDNVTDKLDTSKFKVIEEKDMKGGDMYFCSTHGEHCKSYCEAMCGSCNHILND